jgi:hypothetical protein
VSRPLKGGRRPALVGIVVAAGLALQTVQTVSVTRQVLRPDSTTLGVAAPPSRLKQQAAEAQRRRDDLALALPSARDPFRAPPAATAPTPAPEQPPAPAPAPPRPRPEPTPVLKALMDDNVQPAIQVAVGRARSGWLTRNQTFRGWTVIDIRPGQAILAKGSRRVELSLD